MSDKPISVGDVVIGVHTCCDAHTAALGIPWRVDAVVHDYCHCLFCGFKYAGTFANATGVFGVRAYDRGPLPWLKRIPPLEELEVEKHDEKLTEPA
jgi:hypothetical protein